MITCKQPSCPSKLWAYGYCSKHGQRYKKYGNPSKLMVELHGMRKSLEYRSWAHMIGRCTVPTDKSYKNYGGRGITVCYEWRTSFRAFYEDMGPRPTPKHQLDRIDNNGNYEPSNCRWATPTEQANNRRSNRLITFDGKTMNAKEWSKVLGLDYNTLRQRLFRYNWPVEKAFGKENSHYYNS